MQEYSYNDFLNSLNSAGQLVLTAINEHINLSCPQYKPFDIKPTDKAEKEWRLFFRKKPKAGKAVCGVYSFNGKLSVRFCLLSSMTREFLLRQNEFSDKIKNTALKQIVCAVNKSCRNYGGNNICEWRQFYWVNNRLITACPYPWVVLDDLNEQDIADIKRLINMQTKHMVQDSKEIKGVLYTEGNIQRCGKVKLVVLDEIALDIDAFEIGVHVKKAERLKKYSNLYNLIPMGEKDGLWFYLRSDWIYGVNSEKNEFSHDKIPNGKYAAIIAEDPFTFSFNRVWNYICEYIQSNKESVNGFILNNNENTACFAKFFKENSKEYMAVYVPVK